MKLYIHHWNRPGNPPTPTQQTQLLFLHGMAGSGALWRPIAALLEQDFSIVAVDQRAHGKSRPVTDKKFSPRDYALDIIETSDAERNAGRRALLPSVVIGHSMGVRTAALLAELKPEGVSALILVDLGLAGPAGGGLGDGLAQFLSHLPKSFPSREAAREYMTQNSPDPSMGQYVLAVSERQADGSVTFPFDSEHLVATIEAARESVIRDPLLTFAQTGKPIVFLRGALSGVWSRQEFKAEQERFRPYSNVTFLEFEGASHGLPFEKRNAFADVIRHVATRH